MIPLKTSENLLFSDVFRGIKRERWEGKGYEILIKNFSEQKIIVESSALATNIYFYDWTGYVVSY